MGIVDTLAEDGQGEEAALNLSESDLRRMARLTAAQDRRRSSQNAGGQNAGIVSLSAE